MGIMIPRCVTAAGQPVLLVAISQQSLADAKEARTVDAKAKKNIMLCLASFLGGYESLLINYIKDYYAPLEISNQLEICRPKETSTQNRECSDRLRSRGTYQQIWATGLRTMC